MFRLLWKKKALIAFLAVLVLLLPSAVARPAQMLSKTLVTTLAIDRADGEYTLAAEVIVNKYNQTGARESTVITAGGLSVGEALNHMSAGQGREVSLGHCTLIVLGGGIVDINAADLLEYFLNKTELNNNCALMFTDAEAGKLLEGAKRDGDISGNALQQMSVYNQNNVFGRPTSLEKFFKDYMRAGATSRLATADKEVESAIFKHGKYVFSLDNTGTQALNFLQLKPTNVRIVHGGEVFYVIGKRARIRAEFPDGAPPWVRIWVTVRVELESNPHLGNEEIRRLELELQQKIENDLGAALNECHSREADVLNLHDMFMRSGYRKFKRYMENKTVGELLRGLDLSLAVDVSIIT